MLKVLWVSNGISHVKSVTHHALNNFLLIFFMKPVRALQNLESYYKDQSTGSFSKRRKKRASCFDLYVVRIELRLPFKRRSGALECLGYYFLRTALLLSGSQTHTNDSKNGGFCV